MSSKKGQIPHEGLFLKIFKDLDNTRDFLKKHFSQEIKQYFDLDSLQLEATNYIDDKMKQYYSDLVFSIRLINHEFPAAKLYLLFEHKGAPELMPGLQILRYMALEWKDLYDQRRLVNGKLPPIIPILIYQGQEDWKTIKTSFQDLVDAPSDSFKAYIPDFSFAFFNVRGMDETKVQGNILLKFYVEIIKRQNDPNIKGIPSRLVRGLLESMERRTALEYIEIFFKYLVKSSGHLGEEDYKKALELLPEGGEKIMETLADQWLKEGEDRGVILGKEQGKLEYAQETLIDVAGDFHGPLSTSLQDKIKSIRSIENLRTLTRKVYKTQSLEEFTELVNRAAQN